MITTFQATGASAGTVKWSNELSMPTTTPERASSVADREHQLGQGDRRGLAAPADRRSRARRADMSGSANTMNSAVVKSRTSTIRKKGSRRRGTPRCRLPLSSSSVNTGTKAPWSGESANRARSEVRHLEGDRERRHRSRHAVVARRDDLEDKASTRDKPIAGGEDRGVTGHRPRGGGEPSGRANDTTALPSRHAKHGEHCLTKEAQHPGHSGNANPKKPAVRVLRKETGAFASWKRAVEGGDAAAAADEAHKALVCSRMDKAVRSGAFHKNTGARKKSRAGADPREAYPQRRR